jgi:hypothetical protein
MKAIVMRQTKTLPLITLIERIFTDQRAAGTKEEEPAGKRLRGGRRRLWSARQDSEEMSQSGRPKPNR